MNTGSVWQLRLVYGDFLGLLRIYVGSNRRGGDTAGTEEPFGAGTVAGSPCARHRNCTGAYRLSEGEEGYGQPVCAPVLEQRSTLR